MRSFFAELRRRNVFRAGALYIAGVWALAQGIAQLAPAFGAPEWLTRWFVIAGVIGFPFWATFAWFYEITPDGLKLESTLDRGASIAHRTGKRLDRWIIATLALAVVLLLTDKFVLHKDATATIAPPAPDKSIAVLPFVDMSAEKDQEYMSDGLAEELLNLLAQIPALHVTSRTSAFRSGPRSPGSTSSRPMD